MQSVTKITKTDLRRQTLSGIPDVDLKILSLLDDKDLIKTCLLDKYTNNICNRDYFWRDRFREKFAKDIPKDINTFTITPGRTWRNFYLSLISYLSKYQGKNLFHKNEYKEIAALEAGRRGDRDALKFLELSGIDVPLHAIQGVAQSGNFALLKELLDKGGNKYRAISGAAEGGHKEIVDYILPSIDDSTAWNAGLEHAARGGHRDLIQFFMDKGATAYNFAILGAIKGGHKDLVLYFINLVRDQLTISDWFRFSEWARSYNQPAISELITREFPDE